MSLETGTYISDLNTANPTSSDPKSQGDDHIRLLKSTIKTTFPNITGAVTPTHTELNYVDGVTSSIQTQIDSKSPVASPTFTGTVTLPSTTSIGNVSNTEIGYLDGVTSSIQSQLDGKQSIDSDLTAIASLASNGIIAKTGSGAASVRTITAPAAGITVADGDGVAGNPTLALANDLAALEGLSTTGLIARTGDGTATTRTITAGAGVTVTNGNGVSGNPTISMSPGVGLGDVLGPSTSTANNIAVYADATGKSLAEKTPSEVVLSVFSGISASTAQIVRVNSAGDGFSFSAPTALLVDLGAGQAGGVVVTNSANMISTAQLPPVASSDVVIVASTSVSNVTALDISLDSATYAAYDIVLADIQQNSTARISVWGLVGTAEQSTAQSAISWWARLDSAASSYTVSVENGDAILSQTTRSAVAAVTSDIHITMGAMFRLDSKSVYSDQDNLQRTVDSITQIRKSGVNGVRIKGDGTSLLTIPRYVVYGKKK